MQLEAVDAEFSASINDDDVVLSYSTVDSNHSIEVEYSSDVSSVCTNFDKHLRYICKNVLFS